MQLIIRDLIYRSPLNMFIENPYQWGVSYDYALPLSENTLLHIHSHGAIHTYKLMRMYVKRFSPE